MQVTLESVIWLIHKKWLWTIQKNLPSSSCYYIFFILRADVKDCCYLKKEFIDKTSRIFLDFESCLEKILDFYQNILFQKLLNHIANKKVFFLTCCFEQAKKRQKHHLDAFVGAIYEVFHAAAIDIFFTNYYYLYLW